MDSITEGKVQETNDLSMESEFKGSPDTGQECSCLCYKGNIRRDIKELLRTAWPIILIQVCQLLLSPISLIFCGHLGDPIKLDGAALAISVINCTVIAVGQGMGTACDTVFSQTIHSGNKALVGVYVQRALILFSLALLPFYALHINIEALLLLVGQHPQAAKLAGDYTLIFLPGAWFYFIYIILSKYLLNMDILYPNVLICIISNVLNALLHYVLMYHLDFGIRGSAISLTASHGLNLVLTVAYIVVSKVYKTTWKGWSTECLEDWVPMTKLCISGMLMVGMEWWAFELGLLLCGILGTTELGANSIILQFDQLWYQVPLSIQIACSIKVGQRLGAGDIAGAKSIGWLAIIFAVILSSIPLVLFCSIPRQLTSIFTNIPEIVDLTAKLLPLVAVYVTFDGISCACKGVMTGIGLQSITAILVFVTYYIIALPIGIPLMFLTWLSVAGFWIGLSINMVVQTVVLLISIPRIDWGKQKKLAFKRSKTAQSLTEEQTPLTKPSNGANGAVISSKENVTTKIVDAPVASLETLETSLTEGRKRMPPNLCFKLTFAACLLVLVIVAICIRVSLPIPQPWWNGHVGSDHYSNISMVNGSRASTEVELTTREGI